MSSDTQTHSLTHSHTHTIKPPTAGVQLVGHTSKMLLFCDVAAKKLTGRPVSVSHLNLFRYLLAGYTRDITFDDLSDLRPEDKCYEVVTKFEKEWKEELRKTKWR